MKIAMLFSGDLEIENPRREDVRRVLREFKSGETDGLVIWLDDRGIECLIVACNEEHCVVDANSAYILIDQSKTGEDDVESTVTGQKLCHKAHELVSRAQAFKAARTFATSGTLDDRLDWKPY